MGETLLFNQSDSLVLWLRLLVPGVENEKSRLDWSPRTSPDDEFRSPSALERSAIHLKVYNPIDPCVQGTDPLITVPDLLLVALDLVMIKIDPEDAATPAPCPYGDLIRPCLLFPPSSSRFLSFWIVAVLLSCNSLTYLVTTIRF